MTDSATIKHFAREAEVDSADQSRDLLLLNFVFVFVVVVVVVNVSCSSCSCSCSCRCCCCCLGLVMCQEQTSISSPFSGGRGGSV